MIDMHSHILPNIDDGSRSIEETLNLIEEAKNVGFTKIVLTPHYIEGYYEKQEKERVELIEEIYSKVKNIELYNANEVYISENIIKFLQEKKISKINNTRYLLFEMPINIKPMNLYEVVYEMLQHKITPILAHPERYTFVYKDPNMIYDLIQKGVLMQANYGSVIGLYGKKAELIVKKFLQNNMIHVLGSDTHRENSIYKKIPEIVNKLKKLIGKETLNILSETNPMKILNDEEIQVIEPTKIRYTVIEKYKMTKK